MAIIVTRRIRAWSLVFSSTLEALKSPTFT